MKLKVCGMKYRDNINEVAILRPDFLGFIFHEGSPRNFKGIIPIIPSHIDKVGVFVDKPVAFIIEHIAKYNLDVVQLHGHETPEICAKIKGTGTEVIKVFSIKNEFNFNILKDYENVVDYFLFDTKGELPGGNGYTFDWSVLQQYPSTKPFLLSGGIGLDQIEKLKKFQKDPVSKFCHAVDVNSQFEIEPGLKNINKLEEFKSQL